MPLNSRAGADGGEGVLGADEFRAAPADLAIVGARAGGDFDKGLEVRTVGVGMT